MATKLQFGIIGLGQSGKTTIFNALSGSHASVGDYSSAKTPNIAMVKIPDPRVDKLAVLFDSAKKTFGEIEFIDIAGMTSQAGADHRELAGRLDDMTYVHAVRMAHALMIVVRCFEDENVPHPDGSINPARDIAGIESEMMLIDLVQIEKRIEKLNHLIKVRATEENRRELVLMNKMKDCLESDRPLREMEFTRDDTQVLGSFRFLSQKPALYLLNLDENHLNQAAEFEKKYFPKTGPHMAVTSLCGKIEMEIAALEEADRGEFLRELGIEKAAADRVIRKSFELLGYISFLTAGETESRAWPIPEGFTAYEAAGEIHTDLQRGFIKAETVHYDDLVVLGSWNAAKKSGKLRLEGKEYIIKDGDTVIFRFNV